MLSNPSLESSEGRSVETSTLRASRSRIALAYSARLRRCKPTVPGFGCWAAYLSSELSTWLTNVVNDSPLRARHASRRHHAGAKLPDNLFPSFRTSRDLRRIHRLQREAAGLQPVVVADLAILRNELLIGCGGVLRGDWKACAEYNHRNGDETRHFHWTLATGAAAAASFFISFSISAMVEGLRSGALVARKTPSAQTIGVRPCLSLTSSRAP